jgi:hypothetical protein
MAFAICSAVSIFLVISYLRLVVGTRFAMREAALARIHLLVAFSYAFFLKGFTGLARNHQVDHDPVCNNADSNRQDSLERQILTPRRRRVCAPTPVPSATAI